MLDTIIQWDQWLFHLINYDWHNAFLDKMMPLWREKKFWIPMYLVIAGFVWYKFRLKGLFFILAAILAVAISDPVSSRLIKKTVKRDRPCREVSLKKEVKVLVHCGGGYSFTSSHATNHFAIGAFLFLTLGRLIRSWRWLFLVWAASIAFGQVYVGVHYPLDVLGGALLGSFIGWLIARIYRSRDKIRIDAFWQDTSVTKVV